MTGSGANSLSPNSNGQGLYLLCFKSKYLHTLPTAEILSGKIAREWVSMVLYLKK